MIQPAFDFSRPVPVGKFRERGPNTSRLAAYSVGKKINPTHKRIIELLFGKSLTNEQIADELALPIQTICPRMKELREKGIVIDAGYCAKTKSDKLAKVWKLKFGVEL